MADIIKLEDRLSPAAKLGADEPSHEQFLIDEGLDLLSAYRAISDRDVQLALKVLIDRMAKIYS